MANIFKPKRSSTASSVPTTSDLADGEIAVNSSDKKIYLRDGQNVVEVANANTNIVEDTSPQLGGNLDLNGNNITGSGNIPAANLTGTLPAISGASLTNLNATNLASGTIPDARFPSALPAIDGSALTGITAEGTGAIGGLTIKNQSGAVVGTAGSVSTIDFDGSQGVTVTATSGSSGIATVVISADLVTDTSPQLGGTLDTNGNLIQFGDSSSATDDRLQFGASQDLQIYHAGGTANKIESGSNTLYIAANDLQITNAGITEACLKTFADGGVELYYDNSKKFETTTSGATLTGALRVTDASTYTVDVAANGDAGALISTLGSSAILSFGTNSTERVRIDQNGNLQISTGQFTVGTTASSGLQFINDGTFGTINSIPLKIRTASTERLRIQSNGQILFSGTSGDNQFTSRRTNSTSSSGDYFFQLNAQNNSSTTVGSLGFHRDTATDDSRFVIFTRNTGGSNTERLRITSGGNVGINTTTFAANGTNFKVSDGTISRLALDKTGANARKFEIGNFGTGLNVYDATADEERLRITSGGNVLVGTTDDTIYNNGDSDSEGIVLRDGEVIDIARKGDLQLTLNRQTNDGPHIGFFRSGSAKSYISTRDDAFCIDVNSSERLRITSAGQLQATGAADVRLTLGSGGTAGTNDSVHIRADGANLLFMNASGGITRFEQNGTERLRIASDGAVIVGTDTTVNPILRVLGASSDNSFIQFADGDSNNIGQLQYSHSLNALIVAVNGGEKLRITSDGVFNFGHGTSTNLHGSATAGVNINGNGNSGQIIANASANRPLILGRQSDYGTLIEFFQGSNTQEAEITIPAADTFAINTGGTERVRITSGGNFGINNTSPTHPLHISKNTSGEVAGIKISGNNGQGDGGSAIHLADNETVKWSIFTRRYSSNNRLYISTAENSSASSRVTITEGGSVGINDNNPSYKLSVDNGTTDGNVVGFNNDEVGIIFGTYGTGSTYPREATINGTRFDQGSSPYLRIAGQGGIKFCADLNTVRLQIGPSGQLGLGGANYGTSGQVLTSNGSGSAPTWQAAGGATNAGTLDGLDSSQFLRSDVDDGFSGNITGAGNITLDSNIGSNGSTAFASMSGYLGFTNDYSDTARGPNKVRLQTDGSWLSGLGISNNSTDIYTGGNFNFYKSVSTTVFTHLLGLSSDATLTSKGKVVIDGSVAPNTLAYLNIGSSGSGETRAIDIDGNWDANESKSISFTHGSNAADLVGQINCVHQSPGSMIQFGRLYHSGNSSVYPLKLYSTSASAAALSLNNNTVWHAGNDGSGSGLDADTLDGLNSGAWIRADATSNTDTNVKTRFGGSSITQQSGSSAVVQINGFSRIGALAMHRSANPTSGNGAPDADHEWLTNIGGVLRWGTNASTADNKIWHAGNDGSGSGLDADTLDGINSGSFLRSDATTTFNANGSDFNFDYDNSRTLWTVQRSGTRKFYLHTSGDAIKFTRVNSGTLNFTNGFSIGTDSHQKLLHIREDSSTTKHQVLIQNRTNDVSTAGIAFIASGSDFSDGQYAAIECLSGGTGTTSQSLKFLTSPSGGTPAEALTLSSDKTATFYNYVDVRGSNKGVRYWRDSLDRYGHIFYSGGVFVIKQPAGDHLVYQDSSGNELARLRTGGDFECFSQIRATGWWGTRTGDTGNLAYEIGVSSGEAYGLSYNRDTGSYGNLNLSAVDIKFNEQGGTTTISGNEVWHAGNDGSGSGLDADTLDGINSGSFLRSDANDTTSGRLTVQLGYTSDTDYHLYLRQTTNAEGATIKFADDTNATQFGLFTYKHSDASSNNAANSFHFNSSESSTAVILDQTTNNSGYYVGTNVVWHAGNDGSGSGLDADTLDGINSGSFLRSDTGDTVSTQYTFSSTSTTVKLDFSGHAGASQYNYFMRAQNDGGVKAVHFVNGSTRSSDGGPNTYTIRNDGGNLRLGKSNYATYVEGSSFSYGSNAIWHAGNDGSGSGLDADTLDGKNSSLFLGQQDSISTHNWNDYIDGTEASWRPVLNHSGSNRPSASYTYGTALSIAYSGYAKFQLYAPETGSSGNGLYYRTGWNTNYRAWVELWDSGNDGAGSGLDADTLDGVQGASYLRSDASDTYTGTLSISGSINNASTNGSSGAILGNLEVGYGAAYNSISARSNNTLHLNYNSSGNVVIGSSNTVWHAGNDGSGSGLDADTVDGIQASSFLRSDASDTMSGTLTLTGSGENLVRLPFLPGTSNNQNPMHAIEFWEGTSVGSSSNCHARILYDGGTTHGGDGSIVFNGYVGSNPNTDIAWFSRDGNAYAQSSYRAPIFYDKDNTNYYVNPAGNSVFNGVAINGATLTSGYSLQTNGSFHMNNQDINYVNQLHFYDGVRFVGMDNDQYLKYKWNDTGSGGIIFYDGDDTRHGYIYGDGSGRFGLLDNDGSWAVKLGTGTEAMQLHCNGDLEFEVTETYTKSLTSSRAPLFYDSNDTNYYLDPTSTSDSALRIRGGALHGPNVTWGDYLLVGGDGRQNYQNNTTTASVCTTDGNLHLDAASGHGLYLNYYDGSNVYFGSGGNTNVAQVASDGTFRSPVFYDYNDTGYYLNPASDSTINGLYVDSKIYFKDSVSQNDARGIYFDGGSSTSYAIYREAGSWSNPYPDLVIGFHTGIKIGGHKSYNGTRFYNREPNGSEALVMEVANNNDNVRVVNTFTASGDCRSPVFYDSNDTAAYVNPNGTSNFKGQITIDRPDQSTWMDLQSASNGYGRIRMFANYGDPVIEFSDASNGAGQDQVWSLGADDRDIGSFVVRWQNATLPGNDWTASGTEVFQLKAINSTTVNMSLSAGDPNSYRLHVGGTAYATGDMRAPIFYDSNNTSYYLDPTQTGTSLNVAGAIVAAGNVTAYSDIKFKEDVKVIPDAVKKVKQIRGVTYTRNDLEDREERHTGVIAQEVEQVLPEAVREGFNGKTVAYGNMVGLLIEAIKEQQEMINRQQNDINNLKQQIKDLQK